MADNDITVTELYPNNRLSGLIYNRQALVFVLAVKIEDIFVIFAGLLVPVQRFICSKYSPVLFFCRFPLHILDRLHHWLSGKRLKRHYRNR